MEVIQQLIQVFGLNQTIFAQAIIFVAVYWAMKLVALKPVAGLLIERDERIAGRRAQSVALRTEVDVTRSRLDKELMNARTAAGKVFSEYRVKAQAQTRTVMTSARERAAEEMKSAARQVQLTLSAERAKVRDEAGALSQVILQQIQKPSPRATTGAREGRV